MWIISGITFEPEAEERLMMRSATEIWIED
jgi:hypothetical protein